MASLPVGSPHRTTSILRVHCLAALVLSVLVMEGCTSTSGHKVSYPPGYPRNPIGYVERGVASWYGPGFHGNRTANGEIYNMNEFTAAHQTLPLGSIVQVRSLTNGRVVTVRINDRGPFVGGRVLDLSYAGARALGMIGPGTDEIELRVVAFRGRKGALRIQVGSFSDVHRARAMLVELEINHYNARIVESQAKEGALYRVQVGYYQTEDEAEAAARRLGTLLSIDPLIVREEGP